VDTESNQGPVTIAKFLGAGRSTSNENAGVQ
jgi:hypothetical protein